MRYWFAKQNKPPLASARSPQAVRGSTAQPLAILVVNSCLSVRQLLDSWLRFKIPSRVFRGRLRRAKSAPKKSRKQKEQALLHNPDVRLRYGNDWPVVLL